MFAAEPERGLVGPRRPDEVIIDLAHLARRDPPSRRAVAKHLDERPHDGNVRSFQAEGDGRLFLEHPDFFSVRGCQSGDAAVEPLGERLRALAKRLGGLDVRLELVRGGRVYPSVRPAQALEDLALFRGEKRAHGTGLRGSGLEDYPARERDLVGSQKLEEDAGVLREGPHPERLNPACRGSSPRDHLEQFLSPVGEVIDACEVVLELAELIVNVHEVEEALVGQDP